MGASTKTLVLLANSCKNNERCVAGKELAHGRFGPWVRPTSARPAGELRAVDQRLASGGQAAVLDVVDVPMRRPIPVGFQTENHLIVPGHGWVKRGRVRWEALHQAIDPCETLWINGYSSWGGCNDRVPAELVDGLRASLCLIGPLNVTLRVIGGKVRARFSYRHAPHDLSVTDPAIKAAYATRANGCYPVADAFICVSLAPVWNGHAYKLAAALITPQQAD
jgi:hypothetical protein